MARLIPPADERAAVPLWRNLSFLLMWSSVAASGFSDRIIQLAGLHLLGASEAGAQAAGITAAITFFFFAPYLVFTVLGGWLADRLPRKWIMLACDESRAALLLLAMLLVPAGAAGALPTGHHWKVYAVIAAVGSFAAIFSPVRNAVIPQIVRPVQLQRGNALIFAIAVTASLVGYQIGGRIIAGWSLAAGLLVGVVAYAVSGTFFAFIRPVQRRRLPALEARPPQPGLAQAARYILRHRRVWQLVLVSALIWAAANLLQAALAALAKHRYGMVEPEQFMTGFADLAAAAGGGMLLSAVVVGAINFRRESHWFLLLALVLAGACMTGLALVGEFGLGIALSFGTGFFGNAAIVCAGTLLQSISPNYIRGRIFAASGLVSTVSSVAINLAIWQLPQADQWMIPALLAVGGLLIVVGAIAGVAAILRGPMSPAANLLWRLDRIYALVWHRFEWVGRHHIPAAGPVIFAANHTTGLDPLLMQAACPRVIRWLMLESYRFRLFEPVWRTIRPITLEPKSRARQVRQVLAALEAGDVVGLFPEGGLQRTRRELRAFEPGVAMIARRGSAPIVPVWIVGTPRRQRMIWHFLQPSRSTVAFGEPFQTRPDQKPEEILAELRRRMEDLAASMPAR
ncbi:MAG: MFS transporter [Phycisphaeraceae bacterium]